MYGFFLDIDGTFYDGKISSAVMDAITRARAAGHKVFINTSRAYIGMPQEVYDYPFDGYVNSFGLEVCVGETFVHRHFIPAAQAHRIAQYAFDNRLPLYFEGEIRVDIHRDGFGFTPADLQEFDKLTGRVSKFVLSGPPNETERALFGAEYDFIGGEGIAKGHGKAYGVRLLEELCGIPHENTVAIGDTFLDIDMVTYAGIGIAMGNSTNDLLQVANFVTRSIGEDGVAYAIDCVLNGNIEALKK